MDQPITYEGLFDTLRREKSRDELQAMDRDFYNRVRDFLAAKEDAARSAGPSTLAGTRAQIEHQNVRKILREFYERRERKIVTMALHRLRTDSVVDTTALLPEETALFAALCSDLEMNRTAVLANADIPAAARREIVTDEPLVPQPRGRVISMRSPAPEGVEVDDGDTSSGEATEVPFITVRFVSPIPKFAGPDGNVLGPFEAGDQASVPRRVAEILVRKGKAEEAVESEMQE